MDEFAFWQQKLIQFFHDPPGKPFASLPRAGGHTKVARQIFDAFQQHGEKRQWRYSYRVADWAASGADRPYLVSPKQKGTSPLGSISWPTHPWITHPLAPNQRVRIPTSRRELAREDLFGTDDFEIAFQEQVDAVREIGALVDDWADANSLRAAFTILWRRLREDLLGNSNGDPLWNVVPADSRCPDHSIWDHLKVVTALAFMKPHRWKDEPRDEGAQEPWMLRMTLGPVGKFIEQSRTTRDLWLSSFLLSDLAFAALSPFIETYGPDCVVYPDLFRNPRADSWLYRHHREALAPGADPCTFAAVLPESFVVLAPKGGVGNVVPIEELAEQGRERLKARWNEYMKTVRSWFDEKIVGANAPAAFEVIWQRQQEHCPIYAAWTALPWKPPERLKSADSLRRPALPTQTAPPVLDEGDQRAIEARRARLAPWVPPEVWSRYELARDVFAQSHLELLQSERGFDYALTHHQLSARQAIRLQTNPALLGLEEPGEKCTLCGLREALHAGAVPGERLGQLRQSAREFWQHERLDPNRLGAERLCAVCAMKRFLIEADQNGNVLNNLWAGAETPLATFYRDGRARVPFPSTATIAAQVYLERVVKSHGYRPLLRDIVRACRDARLGRTSFPNALPRLGACKTHDTHKFLEYEAEDVVFHEALDGKIQDSESKGRSKDVANLGRLKTAVRALREKAGSPNTDIAVVRVDGDRMGSLLLGEAEAIAARWRDVLHPEVLKRLPEREHLLQAGWRDLLDAKRLMGPTLHAFVSRVLAHFAHRIAPFVVEHEFSGRLIYAGGDDILALAPADEALALAARLQQLFSAAWVVDTRHRDQAWDWRRPQWDGEYDQSEARRRFLIPLPNASGEIDPAGSWTSAAHVAEEGTDPFPVTPGWRGELLPLMGAGASLSAGVAIGHYKTPLSVLLKRSAELQELAKQSGRARVGVGHASRGGEKSRTVLPWGEGDTAAHHVARMVAEGFRAGHLPSRLPYKLRAIAPALRVGVGDEEALRVLSEGLFRICLEGGDDEIHSFRQAALRLWLEGVNHCHRKLPSGHSPGPDAFDDAIAGLLFCRKLAGLGDGE